VKAATWVTLNARMQCQKILEVAALQREFIDGLVGQHSTERGARRVYQGSFIPNLYDLGTSAGLQSKVDFQIVANFDLHLLAQRLAEVRRFRCY
jgi:hypothetical protein